MLMDRPFSKSLLTSFDFLFYWIQAWHSSTWGIICWSIILSTNTLKQNKNTSLQLPFPISLTLYRKKNAASSITHTSHALDSWHTSRCLPRDYFKSGLLGTGWPGCCDCLYTPRYVHEFPHGFVCLKKDHWNRLFVSFGCREQVTGKGGTVLVAST